MSPYYKVKNIVILSTYRMVHFDKLWNPSEAQLAKAKLKNISDALRSWFHSWLCNGFVISISTNALVLYSLGFLNINHIQLNRIFMSNIW